jgi:hypothetical protein
MYRANIAYLNVSYFPNNSYKIKEKKNSLNLHLTILKHLLQQFVSQVSKDKKSAWWACAAWA